MGRTTAKTKKSTGKRKKKVKQDAYVQAIIIIIISLVLAVLIYGRTGTLGKGLSMVLGGLMGWIKYLVPIGAFVVGIILTKEDKRFVMPKIIQYGVIILCICGIMGLLQISNHHISISGDFGDAVSKAYEYGESDKGGGALGAIVAVPLYKVVGVASYVILIGASVLLTIFTFGIKPAELVDKFSEKMQEARKYEEDDEEEEEEIEEIHPPKRRKETKKKRSEIMKAIMDDEEEDKPKFDHDIPLAFEEVEQPKLQEKINAKLEKKKIAQEVQGEQGDYIEANLFKEKKEEKEEKVKQELQLEHSQIVVDENYEFPPIALLEPGTSQKKVSKAIIADNAARLQKTLHSFNVAAKVENVSVGPAITRYELKPAEGVRVNKIANLADDIALSLAAQSIRIEAPIPRKTSSRNRDTKSRRGNGTSKRYNRLRRICKSRVKTLDGTWKRCKWSKSNSRYCKNATPISSTEAQVQERVYV